MTTAVDNIRKSAKSTRVLPPPLPSPPPQKKTTRSQHNLDWWSRRGKYFVRGAARSFAYLAGHEIQKMKKEKKKEEKRGKRKEGRKEEKESYDVYV